MSIVNNNRPDYLTYLGGTRNPNPVESLIFFFGESPIKWGAFDSPL